MRLALVAALCCAATPAPAAIFSISDIAAACADSTVYYNYGRCVGFVLGVHDAAIAVQPDRFCVPLQQDDIFATEEILAPVLSGFHSASGTGSAADRVLAALEIHFPCTGSQP